MKTYILRNTYAAIAALFIALFALPQQTRAETLYSLWIAGTRVTSANCDDLTTISGVSGTVKYDPRSKTLTLHNATIKPTKEKETGIDNQIDGLTILLIGNNTITSKKDIGIYNSRGLNLTLTGKGKLTVKSLMTTGTTDDRYGIYNVGTITVRDCTLEASGGIGGLSCGHWKFDRCNVKAKGGGEHPFMHSGSISQMYTIPEFTGCKIIDPEIYYWKDVKISDSPRYSLFGINNLMVTDWVTIKPITKYGLKICGKYVTSDNCDDLTVIDGVSGMVKYDPLRKILTLLNAKMNVKEGNACINSEIEGLTIEVINNNELNAINWAAITFGARTTITGSGTLNAKAQEHCGIFAVEADLTINNCIVNAKGEYGIAGSALKEKLLINKAMVTAEGERGSIYNFREITLKDCAITQPAGAVVDNSRGAVVLNGNIVTSEVKIKQIIKYDLKIAGTQVTSLNCNDLGSIGGVSGTVKYDPVSQTLTLDHAKIKATKEEHYGIRNQIDGLTIRLIGVNTVSSEKSGGMFNGDGKGLTITGNGKLTVKGSMTSSTIGVRYGIANLGGITVSGCTLEVSGGRYGLCDGYWKFDCCTVHAKGYGGSGGSEEGDENDDDYAGSFSGIEQIPEFTGCDIIVPEGTYWKKYQYKNHTYYSLFGKDNKVVTAWVTIKPVTKYDLKIAGTQVTSLNCNDLGSIDGVSGTVKYDPGSKTLTLDNARISCDERVPFFSDIDGLTIKVVGTNNLTTTTLTTISLFQPVTITGGGVLNAKSGSNCAIYAYRTHLTIDNCTVNAEGGDYGIAGNDGSSEKLTIKNATVTAVGTKKGSICDLAEFETIGCEITQPTGATFDSSKHGVVLNGELVKSKVVIKKNSTAIEAPTADTAAKQGIYTIGGVKLNGEVKDLPKGIYIVNGKKVVKK